MCHARFHDQVDFSPQIIRLWSIICTACLYQICLHISNKAGKGGSHEGMLLPVSDLIPLHALCPPKLAKLPVSQYWEDFNHAKKSGGFPEKEHVLMR